MKSPDFPSIWAIPADIRARQRRIDRLRQILDSLPAASDPGQGPSAEVLRTELEDQIREIERLNRLYDSMFPYMSALIEEIPSASLRAAVSLKWCEGKSWSEVSRELGGSPSGWRKRVTQWLERFNRQ